MHSFLFHFVVVSSCLVSSYLASCPCVFPAYVISLISFKVSAVRHYPSPSVFSLCVPPSLCQFVIVHGYFLFLRMYSLVSLPVSSMYLFLPACLHSKYCLVKIIHSSSFFASVCIWVLPQCPLAATVTVLGVCACF